jgi:hypothetical protein
MGLDHDHQVRLGPADGVDVRRATSAGLGVVGAVLIGGVAQTFAWRWGVDALTAVTNSQFLWLLLCFVVAWGWSRGSLPSGAAAGAGTGLALIVSYYLVQWLVDGRYSAVDQFVESSGAAWVLASAVGGAAAGLLGALAGGSSVDQAQRRAVGLATAAVLVGGGPAAWIVLRGGGVLAAPGGSLVAAAVYLAVGAALVSVAVRRSGWPATVRGVLVAVVVAGGLAASLYVLQRTILYVTF